MSPFTSLDPFCLFDFEGFNLGDLFPRKVSVLMPLKVNVKV